MATTAPVPRSQLLPETMTRMLAGLMPDIRTLLPADISYEQFRAALWLELTGRTTLRDCTPESLREAIVQAATNGLLPGRDAHLLPFRNKRAGGKQEATFVPNYFGILLALERTGKVRKAFAQAVCEHDEFHFDFFSDDYSHVPAVTHGKAPGKELFYYGAIQTTDGAWHIEPMSLEQIDAVRRRAPAHDQGPWVSDFPMMARKTAMKRCAKYVRLTPQQAAMLQEDDARERTDIPPERHAQNIVDLFGDGNGGFSAESPAPTLWRETLEAHLDQLPAPLQEHCRAALEDLTTPQSRGLELAGAVLDWVSQQEEGV